MQLLHIDSSVGPDSVSRRLSEATVDHWRNALPQVTVTRRDLARSEIPLYIPPRTIREEGGDIRTHATSDGYDAISAAVIDEFLRANVVVIGAPMYNFAISSQLKNWIDHIAVPGKTFRYTSEGASGLAGDKIVILISTRGGVFSDGPMAERDHQESYLAHIFEFMGISDVRIVRAEGLSLGEPRRALSIDAAYKQIGALHTLLSARRERGSALIPMHSSVQDAIVAGVIRDAGT